MLVKTGIYFIEPIRFSGGIINYEEVINYARNISLVSIIWKSSEFRLSDPEDFAIILKKNEIQRLIIAGETPGMEKTFFARAMVIAGNKPENVMLASFREHGVYNKNDTDLAKAVIACAVHNVPFEKASTIINNYVNPATLIIGGGIAGIQASLEIANAGQKVYLVEKTGTIGGYMATFDKTFPTLDCAACILTPKMVEVGQHPNIELFTYSEVKNILGVPGDYKAKILKKARFVNQSTCIGCGTCAEKCPSKVPSEFDAKTTLRKAIYIPFPQAVPNKYLIDADNCTKITQDKCGVCAKVCPVPDCINYEDKDEEIEVSIGNIILATGYKPFDATRDDRFGYGKLPNVLTSLEFERLVNASGPTDGNIYFRTQDKKGNWIFRPEGDMPERIAIIHCVGSRDENFNKYCSKVCCMYSLKLAHLVKEKIPDVEVFEYYIDIRAFGKGYEEFYKRIEEEGVEIIRGRTAKVEDKNGRLWLRSEDIEGGKLIEQEVDMVILAVGLEPREDAIKIAEMAGISQTEDGWFIESNYISNPTGTLKGGIFIAGVCQGPKDIPDTVAQASAAASKVLQSIMSSKIINNLKDTDLKEIESNISKLIRINE
ncbi:MAG: CoB--CoM heterodisulfide reductase iron-sulfur subunit A family protein [Bacteroidales bacterium]|nr:CoB--CoM heterodisulfide reductase iron-sulfur subunit A family protein [Bacteroidales bacterium]